jgi:hypothetical protein
MNTTKKLIFSVAVLGNVMANIGCKKAYAITILKQVSPIKVNPTLSIALFFTNCNTNRSNTENNPNPKYNSNILYRNAAS